MIIKFCHILFLVLLLPFSLKAADGMARPSEGADDKYGNAFVVYVENDSRRIGGPGSDQAYSNGFKASYIYAKDRVPTWASPAVKNLKWLDPQLNKAKINFELSLGHQIYTPNNIRTPELIPNDRPYAAWLYLGFATSLKEENYSHLIELDIGVVGPSAFGKQVQNGYHRVVNISPALGWDNGLRDEPTLQLFYQKRFRTFSTNYLELIPYYGGAFGNVQIGAHIGGIVRLGINLPDDFGPSRPSASDGDSFISADNKKSSHSAGYYIFGGVRGNAFARNIFLDGNTFRSSHHVTKLPFGFDTEFGFGAQAYPIAAIWRFVVRSPEFEEKRLFNSFAGLNFVYYF